MSIASLNDAYGPSWYFAGKVSSMAHVDAVGYGFSKLNLRHGVLKGPYPIGGTSSAPLKKNITFSRVTGPNLYMNIDYHIAVEHQNTGMILQYAQPIAATSQYLKDFTEHFSIIQSIDSW